jgi:ADP-heptose:LPS heptosyltransferase
MVQNLLSAYRGELKGDPTTGYLRTEDPNGQHEVRRGAKVSGVLVSQLARMGDLTQSLYLLEDLVQAESHPVSVLVDKRLEAFVRARVPGLEAVYTVDLERYLRGFREGRAWTGLWQTLADELRPLWGTKFARIINLNYGKLPGAVAEAICGEAVLQGFHVGGEASFGDPWVDLVSRWVQSDRRWNRFHLVDVFRFHSARRIPGERWTAREAEPLSDHSVLGIQIATRCEKRTWGLENFIEIIRRLEEEVGCEVLLFGEGREGPLAEHIVRSVGSGRLHNLVGKTSLEDLVDLLGACDRLLSADTGTLHLAAHLGVPCLAIFFGPAYVFETGPYGQGHIVLQAEPPCGPCKEDAVCEEQMCRQLLDPKTVLQLLKLDPVGPCSQNRIYISDFVEDWIWYRPLHRRQATRQDVIGFLCRGCAGEYLGEHHGRMPSLPTTLQLLLDHYSVNRSLIGEIGESLEFSVPKTLSVRDRERLRGILRRGWTQLKVMHDESVGEQSVHLETAAA